MKVAVGEHNGMALLDLKGAEKVADVTLDSAGLVSADRSSSPSTHEPCRRRFTAS